MRVEISAYSMNYMYGVIILTGFRNLSGFAVVNLPQLYILQKRDWILL